MSNWIQFCRKNQIQLGPIRPTGPSGPVGRLDISQLQNPYQYLRSQILTSTSDQRSTQPHPTPPTFPHPTRPSLPPYPPLPSPNKTRFELCRKAHVCSANVGNCAMFNNLLNLLKQLTKKLGATVQTQIVQICNTYVLKTY